MGDCQPITQLAGNRWPTLLRDISGGGVGIRLSRRFEPGTLLALTLGPSLANTTSLPLARVQRVSSAGVYWWLGCAWADEMNEDDLYLLVGPRLRRQGTLHKIRRKLAALEALPGVRPTAAASVME